MTDPELSEYFRELVERAGFEDPRVFMAAVNKRLRKGEAEYADNPSHRRGFHELVAELSEEAEDIAGWGSRAYSHPEMESLLASDADHVQNILLDIALDAFRISRKAAMLEEFLLTARARRPKPEPEPVGCGGDVGPV